MPGNHFGWSLSDAVDNPRQTGLVNFRRYKLLEYQNKAGAGVSAGDDEDLATTNQFHRLISEETTATTTRRLMGTDLDSSAAAAIPPPFSRPSVKPYYGRENSVSQCSDSCFGSDYPSLTSTGKYARLIFQKLIELNQSSDYIVAILIQHTHYQILCLYIILKCYAVEIAFDLCVSAH